MIRVIQLKSQNNKLLGICGSVFVIAEARDVLVFEEPRDSDYIFKVEGCNLRHDQDNIFLANLH